ncbi:MAG: hypothetical protein OXN83_00270, partial [Oligoflexia bacterium]|nr:hypothetical protein [Oligoflexia bacterium]
MSRTQGFIEKNRLLLYGAITQLEVSVHQEKTLKKSMEISQKERSFVKSVVLGKKNLTVAQASFKQMSQKEKQKLFFIFSRFILSYYSSHLVYPVQEVFLKKFSLNNNALKTFLKAVFEYDSYRDFITDIIPVFYLSYNENHQVVLSAYIKAIESNHRKENKPYQHPELLDIARILETHYPNVNVNIVKKLLGFKATYFENESLFKGWFDIKESAKLLKPKLFNNFIDTKTYYDQARLLEKTLKNSNKGFIITSATAGVTLNDGFFNNLLFLANERGIPLVVMAVNRETEYLPYVKQIEKKDGSKTYV